MAHRITELGYNIITQIQEQMSVVYNRQQMLDNLQVTVVGEPKKN
jgi:hypothetical protein